MRRVLSIFVLAWVFLIAPAICLGAFGSHHCDCAEINCPDCKTTPSGSSHGCHDDPCPKDVYRTEQDDAGQPAGVGGSNPLIHTAHSVAFAAVADLNLISPCTCLKHQALEPPLLLWGADLFAFAGLATLI